MANSTHCRNGHARAEHGVQRRGTWICRECIRIKARESYERHYRASEVTHIVRREREVASG